MITSRHGVGDPGGEGVVPHCPGHERRSELLDEALHAVLSSVDMRVVLERTAGLLRRFFGATRLTVHRCLDEPPGTAEVLLVEDPTGQMGEPGVRVPLEGSAFGVAVREGRPYLLRNLNADTPRFREEAPLAAAGFGTLACFPLSFEGQILGTLDIAHIPREGLMDCCLESAQRIAGLLAIALHNSLMVEEVRRLNRLLDLENSRLKESIREARGQARYIADSPLMREVISKVRLVAPSDTTVLIRGETGTGKEGLAQMVHEFSPRFGGPYVVANLGALQENLIESELFGYEKGAFTGALQRKLGRFEQADGGMIFLDEVGDAPLAVQARLLRVLQEREIQRVGGSERVKVNARVVAATNRPLERMVEAGTFRSDLYYRLNIFPLHLPPLRERKEDLRPLGAYFLSRQSARMHRKPPVVPESVWRMLEERPWPGNIRELENLLERALILSPGPELVLPELPGTRPGPGIATGPAEIAVMPFDHAVRDLLRRTLETTKGRIYGPAGAANLLGLKPTTLQAKLRKYGLKASPRS